MRAYYDALKAANYDRAHALVSTADRAAKSVEALRKVNETPLQRAITERRRHEIGKTEVEEARAKVDVSTHGVDVVTIQRLILTERMGKFDDPAGVQAELLSRVTSPDAPMVETQQTLFLTKEGGEWRLDFDWDAPGLRETPVKIRPE